MRDSFNTSKNKIEKNWNNTEQNLSNEKLLTRQHIISYQDNFNPGITKIPIITHDVVKSFTASFDELIITMPESLISSMIVHRKFYREELSAGDDILYEKNEIYSLNNISWKYIDNNVLLQIYMAPQGFSNKTFMDLTLIIPNPNIYTPLPKATL